MLIEKLHAENLAELKALPRLVEFAERQEFKSAAVEEYLRGELADYDFEKFSSLVLGCTHFNYFKDTLREILPSHVKILDGNAGTINELMRRVGGVGSQESGVREIKFFYSKRRVTDSAELARLGKFLRRLDEMEAVT